jgi:hypothetical protein
MPLLLGHDDAVCGWAAKKLGHPFMRPEAIIGWVNGEGRLTAAALFHGMYDGGNIDLGLVINPPMARGFIRCVSHYVFEQLQCSRVTVRPPKSNSEAIEQLVRFGFKPECTSPDYYGEGEHALQLRLKRAECRWISNVSTKTSVAA